MIRIEMKNGQVYEGLSAVEDDEVFQLNTEEGVQVLPIKDIKYGLEYTDKKYCDLFINGESVEGTWRNI